MQAHWKEGPIKRFLNFLFKKNLITSLFIIRILLLGLLLLLAFLNSFSWSITLLILGTYLITNLITLYGNDGSDQMNSLILITICLCAIPLASEEILILGFAFIAAQACFSYFSAGVAKLFSSTWRSGQAVKEIFKTRTYGSQKIYAFLQDKKAINLLLCWSVIILETLFPLVLLLPLEWGIIFIFWGITFHFLNAIIMGLNTFFWAFLASYPSIIFINLYIANYFN